MAKNKFNKAWMHAHINDPYVKLAQEKGYRARAAFKLLEIHQQEKIIRPGMVVVDLGATPGSWSQVVREILVGKEGAIHGKIIALDMLPMDDIAGVEFIQGDFREENILNQLTEKLGGSKVDLVISDMAPNLSGIESVDAARIEHLCELAIEFSLNHLSSQGVLLVKAFHGSGYEALVKQFRQYFQVVSAKKPKASRNKSAETYILGKRLK